MEVQSSAEFKAAYHAHIARKVLFIAALLVLIILLSGYSCTISGRSMTLVEGLEAIWNHITGVEFEYNSPEWWDDRIVWGVTMPRVMLALLAGAGLAVAGAIMQSVLSNPLAEPYTMGVSSGVVLGANIAIVLGISLTNAFQMYGVVFNAFVIGLIPVAIILILMQVLRSFSPVTMVLAGVAISYFFGGLNTLLLVTTDDDTLQEAYRWQVGSLDSTVWDEVRFVAFVVVICVVVSLFLSKYFNALSQGTKVATSLGMDVNRFRMLCLILVTIMSAAILCFTGIIGFVGLLAPHIVRMIIGSDNKFVIPASCVFGAAFLLFADTIVRLLTGIDIPVGAVMAFFGAPLFLYIVLRSDRRDLY